MRRLAAGLVLAGVLAACGDDDKDGGGGGGTGTNLTVTNAGTASGNLTQALVLRSSGACEAPFAGAGAATVATLVLSTVPNFCQTFQQGGDPANATVVQLIFARFATDATAPLTTGVYQFYDLESLAPPPTDPQGGWRFQAGGLIYRNGAAAGAGTCPPTFLEAITGGTVTIGSASSASVSGSVSLTLDGGGTISGTFDAPSCGATGAVDADCTPTIPEPTTCQ